MQDSRGKDVFEFYEGGDLQANIVPTQLSVAINYNLLLGGHYFYYVNDTANKTIGTSKSLSTVFKINGAGDEDGKPLNIDKPFVRPVYRFELGFQRNINKFYDVKRIPNWATYMTGFNGYIEYQNINFYDTVSKTLTSKNPISLGLHFHFSTFETKFGLFALSVSGDIVNSFRKDQLIPFQKVDEIKYMDSTVISGGDEFGLIGIYNRVNAYRFRASVPIFVLNWLSISPYGSIFVYEKQRSNFNQGFALNFFNGSPSKKNSSLSKGFGVSIDWTNDGNKWGSRNISIYGSFELSKIKKAPGKKEKKKDNFLY